MTETIATQPKTVRDYLDVLGRRKWLILTLPVVAVVATALLSSAQKPLYEAKAQVLVKRTNIVSIITNVQDPAGSDATRFLNTQASIARAPELADRVAGNAGLPGLTGGRVLAKTSVTPETDVDLLLVTASDRKPANAVRLVNTYATQLVSYKTELDTATVDRAVKSLRARERSLAAHGAGGSFAYTQLAQLEGQLETVGKLLADNTKVLQPADAATKVRPRTRRNAILGGLLGIVLGVALAFFAEAIDRRVRSEREIEEALGLPLLARLPRPQRQSSKRAELAMVTSPHSIDAEIFRKLRTSMEFVNLDRHARTVMVTSAVQQEGKSTTIANLAIAFAQAGKRVALVDLDLRRPVLHRFFHIALSPGATDVAVGRTDLSVALRPLPLGSTGRERATDRRNGATRATNGHSALDTVLHILPAGTLPPSPSDFIQDTRLLEVLKQLADQFDLVLIDGPPLLAFGDGLSLSAHVDGLFPVVRLNVVQRQALSELGRQIQQCRAATLGFVLTGVKRGNVYRYGYEAYGYEKTSQPERVAERA